MAAVVYPEGDRWAWCAGAGAYGGGYATLEEAIADCILFGSDRYEVLNDHPTRPPATLTARWLPPPGREPGG